MIWWINWVNSNNLYNCFSSIVFQQCQVCTNVWCQEKRLDSVTYTKRPWFFPQEFSDRVLKWISLNCFYWLRLFVNWSVDRNQKKRVRKMRSWHILKTMIIRNFRHAFFHTPKRKNRHTYFFKMDVLLWIKHVRLLAPLVNMMRKS